MKDKLGWTVHGVAFEEVDPVLHRVVRRGERKGEFREPRDPMRHGRVES